MSEALNHTPAALTPLLSTADVIAFLGITKVTLWKLEKRDGFPPPIRLGRAKRWQREDIEAYLKTKKAA